MHGARLASLSVVRRRESLSEEPEPEPERGPRPTPSQRLKRFLLGSPKNLEDPHLFRHISLVAFLAWVGLGADGLSSSAYGPEEAFKNLGDHQYLAVFLALATGITVLVISAAYTKIIEHFPLGGGGYAVASRLLGPRAGVVSGSALLIDYVLTTTTSVAAGGEAVFSNLPAHWHTWKLPVQNVRARCSFRMHRSITTKIPALRAFSAARSCITSSCIQIAGTLSWMA